MALAASHDVDPRRDPAAAAVLSKAVVRSAQLLGLSQQQLAGVIGVSPATVSRLVAGNYVLSAERAKEWELARLFVRLFRSLDALWGHDTQAKIWLTSPNLALAARPMELLNTVEGLVRVVAYLDAARGRV
jgi:transcriptional regulator with XRE-family HTH domain